MYKIITSVSAEITGNLLEFRVTGILFLKRVPYNDQFCKNRSLKFDKTLRTC